jgi:hypothetical protein
LTGCVDLLAVSSSQADEQENSGNGISQGVLLSAISIEGTNRELGVRVDDQQTGSNLTEGVVSGVDVGCVALSLLGQSRWNWDHGLAEVDHWL